jgi:hypothetical protein
MTIAKTAPFPSVLKSSKKNLKRRSSDSFGSFVKFETPSICAKPLNDSSLQSTDKKRRYMRRGSKSPSMLTLSFKLECLDSDFSETKENIALSPQRRRLSLMSALKLSFEQTMIAPDNGESSMSSLSTYELLSQV